jgi:recombination protein RecA
LDKKLREMLLSGGNGEQPVEVTAVADKIDETSEEF